MATPIKPKRTFTVDKVPTTADLQDGEMGINVPDGRIYVRQGSEIKLVGSKEQGIVKTVTTPPRPPGEFGISINSADPENPILSLSAYVPNGYVYASPLSASGLPTFRSLVPTDIPTLDASKITTGVLPYGRIPYPQDYIHGFYITTTATSITVSEGEAYVPAHGVVVSSAGTTITSSRTANTVYHLYLNPDGTVVRDTTAPSSPYYLTARRRGVTLNTRYLGSVSTDSSGNYYPIKYTTTGNFVAVSFLYNIKAAGQVVGNGTSTTPTDVLLSNMMPTTATDAVVQVKHVGSSGVVRLHNWDGTGFSVYTNISSPSSESAFVVPTDSTPKIRYDVTTGGVAFIWLVGYMFTR